MNSIKIFFTSIDYSALGKSFKEVLFLTLLAMLPLIINIVIVALPGDGFIEAIKIKILPGEILSYCLSFLAPSLYLLTKIQGSDYKLPLVHFFSLITLLVYVSSVVLYLVAKNNWVESIDMKHHNLDLYFELSIIFLITSIFFRIYSVYHGKNASNWSDNRNKQQADFNGKVTESLNNQHGQ